METLTSCPACSSGRLKPYLACKDNIVSRETFHIVQCEECGLLFTNPRPDETDTGKYYQSEEYISHTGKGRGLVSLLYKTVRNHTIKWKVKFINTLFTSHQPPGINLLDIGCGTGEFLNGCKQNGWNVTGIEPSGVARKNAKEKFGLSLFTSLQTLPQGEREACLPARQGRGTGFNVITMWHVLEHVHQLHRTIEQASKLLADGGVLIVAVPNPASWDAEKYGEHWAAWDLPRHLYHFTKMNVESIFSKHGFMLTGVLPMRFDSYYVSLLSEKYKHGHTNLAYGFWSGLISNLNAKKMNRGFSSQIYILKKHKNS